MLYDGSWWINWIGTIVTTPTRYVILYIFLSAIDLRNCDVDDFSPLRSVEFCCPSVRDYCDKQQLHHSVIKFFNKPLAITLPPRMFSIFAKSSGIWWELVPACLGNVSSFWRIASWTGFLVSSGSQRSLKLEGEFSRLGEHQNWKTWQNSRVLRCFDSSYGDILGCLFVWLHVCLRQSVGRLQVEFVWLEQQFQDSRRCEGGAQGEARTAPRLDMFWDIPGPSNLHWHRVTITFVSPFLHFRKMWIARNAALGMNGQPSEKARMIQSMDKILKPWREDWHGAPIPKCQC